MLQEHIREQIGVIEQALAKAGKSQRAVPLTYILWGIVGAIFNLAYVPWAWIAAHQEALFLTGDALTLAAVATTAVEFWLATRDRRTAMDLQGLAIFGLVTNALWILKFPLFSTGAITGLGYAFLYSMCISIALIVHGAGPLRPLMYGGIFLLATVFFAAMHPSFASLTLAAGNYGALVIPGVFLAFAPRAVRNG